MPASVDAATEAATSVILVSPAVPAQELLDVQVPFAEDEGSRLPGALEVAGGGDRAGARRPGAVAEMSAQAFTLIAGGDAGWLSDDVPSILGRPARSCQQFAGYAVVSPRLLV